MGIGIICCEKPKEDQSKLTKPNSIFGNEEIKSIENFQNSKYLNESQDNSSTKISRKILKNTNSINSVIPVSNDDACSIKKKDAETEFFSNFSNMKSDKNPIIDPKKIEINGNQSENYDFSNFSKIVFFIESFVITYKKYDDYGLSLNPIIFIKSDASHEAILDKLNDGEFDNCKTLTNTLTENISFNNTEYVSKTFVNNNDNEKSNGQGKSFLINSTYCLNLENYETWRFKILRIKIFNKSKSSQYNPIIIGSSCFPLLNIPIEGIEGKIPIRNKLTKSIGHLNVRVSFMLKNNLFYGKYAYSLNSNAQDENNHFKEDNIFTENELDENGININFYMPIENSNDFMFEHYKNCFLNYENIDHILKEKFKIKKMDSNSKLTNEEKFSETVNLKKVHLALIKELQIETPIKKLISSFVDAIYNNNHIVSYGILKFLVDNFEKFEKKYFDEFFYNLMNNKRNNNFMNLFEDFFKSKNFYLGKLYFYFFYKSIIFYKSHEAKSGDSQMMLNLEELFELIMDSLIFLYKNCGELKNYSYELLEELRENIYWIYSCIIELITANPPDNFIDQNHLIASNFIYFNNSIKIINNPKTLIDIFILMNEDSEMTGFVSRIFRKSIQNIVDDINIYPKIPDKNDLINSSFKSLIVDPEKAQKFISFVQICMMRYINYPEIYSNMLLILICLCNESKYPDIIRTLLDNLDISLICSGFDNYRGNLRKIGKNINYFFYKLISQLISIDNNSISNNNNKNNYNYIYRSEKSNSALNINKHETKEICNEILKLFKLKAFNNGKTEKTKTLQQFIKNKNLELHEILCSIASNITKNLDACTNICKEKCFFINDILEYFLEFNKNYIEKNLEKYKNQKREKIPLYLSIIDNSLICFNNICTKNNNTKTYFINLLKQYKQEINSFSNHVYQLIDSCMSLFNLNGNNNIKIRNSADNFFNSLK